MAGRRSRFAAAIAAWTAAFIGLSAPASAATPYEVGAAKVDITPPLVSDGSATPAAFSSCPPDVYGGARHWAFEEPYVDLDTSGDFNYMNDMTPEPYCDANLNGRWDGVYLSGAVDDRAKSVHDPIDARALAISDGDHTVVIASLVAQGIFENYTGAMRAGAQALRPGIDDLVVSANHNESSVDTIGIYGAPPAPEDIPVLGGAVGLNSGINDYYMDYLVNRVAQASAEAFDALEPAGLWVTDFPIPAGIRVRLSNNFPTTYDDGSPAAIDPKVRILQARDADGQPIATMMNLAAHNQEIGHSGPLASQISSDWPGYFHDQLESSVPGMAMFLVADNGSEEDPETVPPVSLDEHPECSDGCYAQAQATGEAWADAVAAKLPDAKELPGGEVHLDRDIFDVPLENNLFRAAAAAGLFGERETYTAGVPSGHTGTDLRTSVAVVNVGPGLQFLANPGEAFPALIQGSPFGIEDAGCPERPNPPVPGWHASAPNRFEIGLADDLIGYELPAWAFSSLPGAFLYQGAPATCVNDTDDVDPAGHQHKLEAEGAGPTASNEVATRLTTLLDVSPDPTVEIRTGRFVYSDGTLGRTAERPAPGDRSEDAVAIWLTEPGSTALAPGQGTIVALEDVGAFGDVAVDEGGVFMEFDGQRQDGADITTRGMVSPPAGSAAARRYVDVYPALDTQPLAAAKPYCDDTAPPESTPGPQGPRVGDTRLKLAGDSSDEGCAGSADAVARDGEVAEVEVSILKRVGSGICRHLRARGRLGKRIACHSRSWLKADGTDDWRLRVALTQPLPHGRYRARSRATDAAGNVEPRGPESAIRFRVR